MARIPEAEIERLKEAVPVERLVEASGIELKKGGKDLLGRCPFHEDATASLVVTPGKNLWHCFGCGVGGGPIDWVMKRQGVSFRHAVELLRADMGSGAGLAELGTPKTPRSRAKLPAPVALDAGEQELLDQVIGYYHETLLASPEALAYLERRGIASRALIEQHRLGFANRTLGLRLPATQIKAGAEVRGRLQKVGILRESGHEHFNGSLVVPVFDQAGHVTEVYGRKLLQGALLMYHSLEDQNTGTDPSNSIRLFHALQGMGKQASLYMYPYEDHGPLIQETLLDQWGRWVAWLDLYVKNAGASKPAAPDKVAASALVP